MPTLASGRIIAETPEISIPAAQKISGSALEVAAAKTIETQEAAAQAAKELGAGQKGASRRRKSKKVKRGGAAPSLNASPPSVPTANSVPGVSMAENHVKAVDLLNQLKADKVYDQYIDAQPVSVGGRRKRSRKAKNGRRHNRTHRRGNRKSTHRNRRSRRAV
jgi:hypothetical protein